VHTDEEDNGWSTVSIKKANSSHKRKIMMAVSHILVTLASWKFEVETTPMSEPVISPLVPPFMRAHAGRSAMFGEIILYIGGIAMVAEGPINLYEVLTTAGSSQESQEI
jgi:hypothetical protein